jgi:hypothetical protein
MQRIASIAFSLLFLAGSVFSFQGSAPPSPKKAPIQKATADCSKADDATLATTVKDKLANTPSLKEFAINVTAKDGVVTLTGSVKKPNNKGLATSQSKRVPCVKKVDNQIAVEGKPASAEKKPKT